MIDRAAENTIPLWILFLLLSFLSTGELIETAAKSSEVFCLFVMSTRTLGLRHVWPVLVIFMSLRKLSE